MLEFLHRSFRRLRKWWRSLPAHTSSNQSWSFDSDTTSLPGTDASWCDFGHHSSSGSYDCSSDAGSGGYCD